MCLNANTGALESLGFGGTIRAGFGGSAAFVNSAANGNTTVLTFTVPEPQSWATMIIGFGLVGVAARRRQAVAAA